jgi:D-alanyl-lipoteichoic acid acyltransferase DltB (MBOAT superfamily)
MFASLFFYAWGEPVFVFIMLFSIFINWLFALYIDKYINTKIGKILVLIILIYNVSLLFIFKYLSFTIKNVAMLLKNTNFLVSIALPIGISFFTFQLMSYILDVYYKKVPVQKNFINIALYVSMFPQLIAGPIVRYETINNEITNRIETFNDFSEGIFRFISGLGKKVLIANYCGFIADGIFSLQISDLSVASAWLGAIAYSLQIFFDFSGYSDMAIGLGRMFGFHFLENFNYPYIAKSITEFWRRWHISLSSWFRDYVYIPLGGNRVKKCRLICNLLIVWLLTGIWHGANWTFIVWGLFYFILLIIERFTHFTQRLRIFSRIYTLFFIIIAWVIFRSVNISFALHYLGVMFGINSAGITDFTFFMYLSNGKSILLAAVVLSTPVLQIIKIKLNKRFEGRLEGIYTILSSLGILCVFIVSVLICIKETYNPFIYFNF